jgi:hypothetical protein
MLRQTAGQVHRLPAEIPPSCHEDAGGKSTRRHAGSRGTCKIPPTACLRVCKKFPREFARSLKNNDRQKCSAGFFTDPCAAPYSGVETGALPESGPEGTREEAVLFADSAKSCKSLLKLTAGEPGSIHRSIFSSGLWHGSRESATGLVLSGNARMAGRAYQPSRNVPPRKIVKDGSNSAHVQFGSQH